MSDYNYDYPNSYSNYNYDYGDYDYNYDRSDDRHANRPANDNNNNRKSDDLVGAFSSGGGDCCPHVVDASFFVLTIGAIAVGTYLIQQRIIMDLGKKRRKKRRKRSNLYQEVCETAECKLIYPGMVYFEKKVKKINYDLYQNRK